MEKLRADELNEDKEKILGSLWSKRKRAKRETKERSGKVE